MPRNFWNILAVLLLASTLILASPLFGVGSRATRKASAQELTPEMMNWEMINHNALGTSHNPQNIINKDNVHLLELKWIYAYPPASFPSIPGASTYAGSGAPALVIDGIVYAATNQRGLVAMNGGNGRQIWINVVPYDNNQITAKYPHVRGVLAHTHAVDFFRDRGIMIPSFQACQIDGHDPLLGDVVFQLFEICGTEDQAKEWGNQGIYASIGTHPPQFFENIMVVPVMGSSGNGGRSFIAGYDVSDMKNPRRVWQTFLMPPARGDAEWALRECSKGWFFSYPEWLATKRLAVPCSEVESQCRDCLLNDWIDPRLNKVHTASTMATIWGHYLVDPETGIVYLGTGESGPYPNAERRPGPNLYGSSIVALDAKTGQFVWWYQSLPHDMWDYDCSWNAMLGKIEARKVLFKACKNGFLYALDAATGEPVWVFHPENLWLPQPGMAYPDPKKVADLTRKWPTSHVGDEMKFLGANYAGLIEADLAYDGDRIYVASYNMPVTVTVGPVAPLGNQLFQEPAPHPTNSTIHAVDVKTGNAVWRFDIPRAGFRGGLTVSGGVLYAPSGDGNLYMLDAETGELLAKKSLGIGLWTQVVIGADPNGGMKVFIQTGGMTIASWGPTGIPGALIALGLPEELPPENGEQPRDGEPSPGEPQVVEVIREVEVPVEVLSPFSYLVIGAGVIMLVISGVVLLRARKAQS